GPLDDLDASGDLELAPRIWLGDKRCVGNRATRQYADQRESRAALQEFSSTHLEPSLRSAGHLPNQVCENLHHVGPRPIDVTFGDEPRPQVPIQNHGRWQRMDIPRPCDCAIAIEQDRKRQRVACEEAAYGAVSFGHADRDDRERLALKPRLQLFEACHFRPAGLAPGGEEVDENHATAMPCEPIYRAVQARQRKQRFTRLLDDRELRFQRWRGFASNRLRDTRAQPGAKRQNFHPFAQAARRRQRPTIGLKYHRGHTDVICLLEILLRLHLKVQSLASPANRASKESTTGAAQSGKPYGRPSKSTCVIVALVFAGEQAGLKLTFDPERANDGNNKPRKNCVRNKGRVPM